jgi:ketosteroid isomerase-like protein
MSPEDSDRVAHQLDGVHEEAKEHYRSKNIAAYMQMFTSDLRYRQADGRMIGKEQLARDLWSQLAQVEGVDSSYRRESLQLEGEMAVELLTQVASVTVRRFLILRRTWHVHRRGRYVWVRTSEGWRIREVEVLDERVSRSRIAS